jgi:hypothetical protein
VNVASPANTGPSAAAATATTNWNLTFNVTNGGSGYNSAPVVILTPVSGGTSGSCTTQTATISTSGVTKGSVTSVTASGCTGFNTAPVVTFNNAGTGGTGATATSSLSQSVDITVTNGGKFYTTAPAVSLHLHTGAGGCTLSTPTLAAISGTQGNKIVTGLNTGITATNCSGLSDPNPTVVIAPQLPSGGTAASNLFAVPGNSVSVTPIEKNPTTLKATACNAGLSASPVVSATYSTSMATPTIVAKDSSGGAILIDGSGDTTDGTQLDASDTITLKTTSNFTGDTLVYSTDGVTTPNCTGTAGTVAPGPSLPIPVTLPGTSLTINVIACGTNQAASALVTRTYHIGVPTPTVSFVSNNTALTPNGSNQVTAENVVSTTITDALTTNTWICYTTNNATPACGSGAGKCDAASGSSVYSAPLSLPSGSKLQAIACYGDGSQASATTVTYSYVLNVDTVVVTNTADACPAGVTIGFSTATSDLNEGGPTNGATVCYSTVGAPGTCTAGNQPGAGTVQCFQPTTAAPTKVVNVFASTNIYYIACATGLNTSSGTLSGSATAYAPPTTIDVDGVLAAGEWSSAAAINDTFVSDVASVSGCS